jgi:hypothetical protein
VSYRFLVLGLLRPSILNLYADGNTRLHVQSASQTEIVEDPRPYVIDAGRTPLTVTGPQDSPASFVLEIHGILRRRYIGMLSVSSQNNLLQPVVTIQREIAVASIVGAELPARQTPVQALAAQALAARSFLCAAASHARHANAQFCDTTHCQFLRSPAALNSNVARAVEMTRGLVLSTGQTVIPAHYSAACGGHTDSAELDHYQYRSVVCEPCRAAVVPRRGHGLGLCQTGAIALAHSGWDFEKIVKKYYPACELRNV